MFYNHIKVIYMNIAFIDGQNLILSCRKAKNPWELNFSRFREYLREKYNVEKAIYYIGAYYKKNEDLYNEIIHAGFTLQFRRHSGFSKSKKKGNVDTDIVFDVMKHVIKDKSFDQIILVSGDGDYFNMVEFLINDGWFCKLLAPDKKKMSSLYKKLEPRYYDYLNREEVMHKIKKIAGSA